MKPRAIIVDLDGTLCNTDHRQHFVQGNYGKKDFGKFYKNMHLDPPNEWCVTLVKIYSFFNCEIIFCSGRPEEYREQTVRWLERNIMGQPYKIYMRETGNYEDDVILKERLYRTHIEPKYDVEFVVDDRKKVVDMWRRIGLVCLQCAPGEF
jgi:FMN phosphatase YigB (HAD superfamily)